MEDGSDNDTSRSFRSSDINDKIYRDENYAPPCAITLDDRGLAMTSTKVFVALI